MSFWAKHCHFFAHVVQYLTNKQCELCKLFFYAQLNKLRPISKFEFWFFLSWHAAKSFNKYLTMESFIPTSMLSIN